MGWFAAASILVVLAGLFAYINCRFIRLPATIGIMLMSLAMSLVLIATGHIAPQFRQWVAELASHIDFHEIVFHGMLPFLLFAGALHLDISDLAHEWAPISALAVIGTIISTLLVAAMAWMVLPLIGWHVPFVYCLLFGAIVSPTDPIAILGLMKQAKTNKAIQNQIVGESLLNDGVGIVLFITLFNLISGDEPARFSHMAALFCWEVFGGAAIGFLTGEITYRMIKPIDSFKEEVLLTIALAMGGYALAESLSVSGPIANVISGLIIGNHGRRFAMSTQTRERLDNFWELIDEILNAVLFLLIGIEVLIMPLQTALLWAGIAAIIICMISRWISVASIVSAMRPLGYFSRGTITLLTWGGLRGGLSVAMALALPRTGYRDLFLMMTYCLVIFSICAQGLGTRALLRKSAA